MTRQINGKTTVPLNGWRMRDLAEKLFGSRKDEDLLEQGFRFLVPAKVIQELPEFDSSNQQYVDNFEGDIVCEIESEDPSYGVHMSIEQAPGIKEMNMDLHWGRWADYIRVTINRRDIRVYWRDVRHEDFIMYVDYDSIRNAKELVEQKELCQGYWCSNDLVYRIIQIYGAKLQQKIEAAGVL